MHHMHGLLLNVFLTIKKIQNTQLRRKLNKVITSLKLASDIKNFVQEGRKEVESS